MRLMTNAQIDKLNELLVDNGETLTAFYDEGTDIGARKGFLVGMAVGLLSGIVIYGVKKIKSKVDKTKTMEES